MLCGRKKLQRPVIETINNIQANSGKNLKEMQRNSIGEYIFLYVRNVIINQTNIRKGASGKRKTVIRHPIGKELEYMATSKD